MRVEAVSPYPPATSRSLERWLDAEYATQAGPETATRLREIARDRATLMAMWAAFVGLGASAVLFTAALFVLDANPSLLPWAIAGAAIALVSLLMMRRARLRVPPPGAGLTTRGPGTLRGGLMAAGGIFLAINAFLVPAVLVTGRVLSLVVIDFGVLLLLISVFVVPATVIGRASASLRRAVSRHPQLLAALEQERLAWTPAHGAVMFGPL